MKPRKPFAIAAEEKYDDQYCSQDNAGEVCQIEQVISLKSAEDGAERL